MGELYLLGALFLLKVHRLEDIGAVHKVFFLNQAFWSIYIFLSNERTRSRLSNFGKVEMRMMSKVFEK